MDITTATPVEIDTALADVYRRQSELTGRVAGAISDIHRAAGDQQVIVSTGGQWGRRKYQWQMGLDEALDTCAARATRDEFRQDRRAKDALAAWKALEDEGAALSAEKAPLTAEYQRRGGWTRAFLATSANGHIHSSRECSTCYETTQFFWFTDLSGHAEAEIVAKAGSDACTVCYPSAPVNDLRRPRSIFSDDEKAAQKARGERAAAKVARDSAKVAKALTLDGSEARIVTEVWNGTERYETFKTAQAAQQFVTSHMADWGMSHPSSKGWMDAAAQIVTMLSAKQGTPVAEVLAEIEKKALAKVKRDKGGDTSVHGVHQCVGYVQSALGL